MFYALVAIGFDLISKVPSRWILAVIVILTAVIFVWEWLAQRRFNKWVGKEKPGDGISLWVHEFVTSLVGVPIMIALTPFLAAAGWLVDVSSGLRKEPLPSQREGEKEDRDSERADTSPAAEKESEEPPRLVASLGPSYLLASALVSLVYLIGLLLDPFLAWILSLSEGQSGNLCFWAAMPSLHSMCRLPIFPTRQFWCIVSFGGSFGWPSPGSFGSFLPIICREI
jgi:hypothetical protein